MSALRNACKWIIGAAQAGGCPAVVVTVAGSGGHVATVKSLLEADGVAYQFNRPSGKLEFDGGAVAFLQGHTEACLHGWWFEAVWVDHLSRTDPDIVPFIVARQQRGAQLLLTDISISGE